jgi:hypothetical protein
VDPRKALIDCRRPTLGFHRRGYICKGSGELQTIADTRCMQRPQNAIDMENEAVYGDLNDEGYDEVRELWWLLGCECESGFGLLRRRSCALLSSPIQ